jgi:hypothetical protein
VNVTEGRSAGIRTVSLSSTSAVVKRPIYLEMKIILGCVCVLFTNAVTDGKRLCGKCAEGNGGGCAGVGPGKSTTSCNRDS